MKTVFLSTLFLLVAACSAGDPDEVKVSADSGSESETVGAEIARDYNHSMNRARNVEVQLDDHKRDLDAAIEKQTDPARSMKRGLCVRGPGLK